MTKLDSPPRRLPIHLFRAVGGLYLLATLVFGLAFPIIGFGLYLLQLAPPGEDPNGPAFTMMIAGPCTSIFYLPVAILALITGRKLARGEPSGETWAIACALATMLTCAPFGLLLFLATFVKPSSVLQESHSIQPDPE